MCIGGYTDDRGIKVLLCRELFAEFVDAVNYYYLLGCGKVDNCQLQILPVCLDRSPLVYHRFRVYDNEILLNIVN